MTSDSTKKGMWLKRKICFMLVFVFALSLTHFEYRQYVQAQPLPFVAIEQDTLLMSLTRVEENAAPNQANSFMADEGFFASSSYLTAWNNNQQITIGYQGTARAPIVINNAAVNNNTADGDGWRSVGSADIDYGITIETATAFQIRFETTGFENIRFSAAQSSTGSGPEFFALAYSIDGPTGPFTPIPNTSITVSRGGGNNYAALSQTFNQVVLPYAVTNQSEVYLRIYMVDSTLANRANGNTSINDIKIIGDVISDAQVSYAIRNRLNSIIGAAQNMHSARYIPNSWALVQDVLDFAIFTRDNPNAQQYEFESAIDNLSAAIAALAVMGIHEIVLSVSPGFHDRPFDLAVSIPSMPDAAIYWTIDGNEPTPGEDRFITRGEQQIQVSGRLSDDGMIAVQDRSGHWRDSILAHHSETWHYRDTVFNTPAFDLPPVLPYNNVDLLQGTAFRFRGFVGGEPVTEVVTATYIIEPNAPNRFVGMPIMSLTLGYEDFLYLYGTPFRNYADLNADITRQRNFYYEYFEYDAGGYERIFGILGSTRLGGNSSRLQPLITLNAHLSRGDLDGVITHPIFDGLDRLYRFRLWNGGQTFWTDHMRDPFAQTASRNLNVLFSDTQLAIKFINGEFWGFTNIREHTSNAHFVHTRTGLDFGNITIFDRGWHHHDGNWPIGQRGDLLVKDALEAGSTAISWQLYHQLRDFAMSYDFTTDAAVARLFDEFFCKDNFMDYIIANTFFASTDWGFNNMRFFRAINPNPNHPNPYNDGRWRFILHDMDSALWTGWIEESLHNRNLDMFNFLDPQANYNAERIINKAFEFNYIFDIFKNPTFAETFRERAIYVLEEHFRQDMLLELLDEFTAMYQPLLYDMYNRFVIQGTPSNTMDSFFEHNRRLREFILHREDIYRRHLDGMVENAHEQARMANEYVRVSRNHRSRQLNARYGDMQVEILNFSAQLRSNSNPTVFLGYQIHHNGILLRETTFIGSDIWTGNEIISLVVPFIQYANRGRYDATLRYAVHNGTSWVEYTMELPYVELFVDSRPQLPFIVEHVLPFEDKVMHQGEADEFIVLRVHPAAEPSGVMLFGYQIFHNGTVVRYRHFDRLQGLSSQYAISHPFQITTADSGRYVVQIHYAEYVDGNWYRRTFNYGMVRLNVLP